MSRTLCYMSNTSSFDAAARLMMSPSVPQSEEVA